MLSSRPPYLRTLRIHERLCSGNRVQLARLVEELEVSDRTVKRDLEFMRDQLGAPIEWDRKERGYYYRSRFEKLPAVAVSADEALAVALAGKVFSAWEGSPLGTALTAGLEKIASVVGNAVSVSSEELDGLIVSPPGERTQHSERATLGKLIEAASSRSEIRFVYKKPHDAAKTRHVRPLHLARLDYQWILIAFDVPQNAIRKYVISRIESLERLDTPFEPPSDFNLNDYLSGSLGRHTGDSEHSVVLEFDAFAAPYIKEERWRPERQIEDLPDGGIRVSMTLNNLVDIRRYLLSWGQHAIALEPAELRDAVHSELVAMKLRYGEEHRGFSPKSELVWKTEFPDAPI